MSRDETDRRIEAALTLFIVSVWLGAISDVVVAVGQARTFWLIRHAGATAASSAAEALAWSWVVGLRHAASCGLVYGLWQIARSLIGGRLRLLVLWAFYMGAVSLAIALIWQPLWSWLVTSTPYATLERAMTIGHAALSVLQIVAVILFVAAIVGLARARPEGTKRRWAARAAAAVVMSVVEMGAAAAVWAVFYERPLIAGAAGVGLAALHAIAYLALLWPARGVFRAAIDHLEVPAEGPYRTAQRPAETWRSAPELKDAAPGLVEVHRRVGHLAALSAISIVAIFVLAQFRVLVVLAVDEAITGIIQLVFAAFLIRGVAAYARLPHEIPGRSLALAALACMMGSWVLSLLTLVIGAVATCGGALSSQWVFNTLPGDIFGCVAASVAGTLLLIGSLARAAGGLGDDEVRRRAWMALGACVAGFCLAAGAVFVVFTESLFGGEQLGAFLPSVSLFVGLAFVFVFRWLLDRAARMFK